MEDLVDPEATGTISPQAIERRMEKEFGITRMITRDRGVAILLASVRGTIEELLRRVRRDEVARRRQVLRGGVAAATDDNKDGNTTREQFAKSPPCPGLILLRHCANLSDNRKKLLANRAPTLLLRILLDILNAMNRSPGTSASSRKRSSTFDFGSSHSMDVDTAAEGSSNAPPASTRNKVHHVEGNPTTDALQEIIEMLASDISAEISEESASSSLVSRKMAKGTSLGSLTNLNQLDSEAAPVGQRDDEDRTLPLVMKSLHSMELSPPLRKVIAKLLPFLTYGQVSQSKELASYFLRYVNLDNLGLMEEASSSGEQQQGNNDYVLMNTFVETAINLPAVSVCDNLRKELISNGFVDKVRAFLMKDAPSQPPPWSPALYPKSAKKLSEKKLSELREAWRSYFDRPGLAASFKILTGLSSRHTLTQSLLSDVSSVGLECIEEEGGKEDDSLNLLTLSHWMESTSDNTASGIQNPNGILAETLLDALKEDNESTSEKIGNVRKKTRDRKRELAEERRNKALVGMSAFGTLAGSAVSRAAAASSTSPSAAQGNAAESSASDNNRSMFASMFSLLAPSASSTSSSQPRTTRASSAAAASATTGQQGQQHQPPKPQPSWMAEMEAMADEAGVTCAVCQEGRTLQPSELLGLYAYMKKVTMPTSQGGGKGDIDGTALLLSLPISLPKSLSGGGSTDVKVLFSKARSAANALEGSSHALSASMAASANSITGSSSSSRTNYYITTVSAGNAIHCSCHKKAKTADRNHPKAPKSKSVFAIIPYSFQYFGPHRFDLPDFLFSLFMYKTTGEWEGASLRNSRVTCNVILPLVSSKTSRVPLMTVETALMEYNTICTNTLGARPKSILWNCLHDIRFLLLRMAHGEALNADCGGGSSSSNFLLLLYQLYSADMFAQNAEVSFTPAGVAFSQVDCSLTSSHDDSMTKVWRFQGTHEA